MQYLLPKRSGERARKRPSIYLRRKKKYAIIEL